MRSERVRKSPAKGVVLVPDQPTIVFLTVCSKNRQPWISQRIVQEMLLETWSRARGWMIGDYLLMPDHLHLFCSPNDPAFTIEQWLVCWKREFTRRRLSDEWGWQRNSFHHRLRDSHEYAEKSHYVLENPVRLGLVKSPEDWPFRGRINNLGW